MNDQAAQTYVLTIDDLVAFAQEGWNYPLEDDEHTRAQIEAWLAGRLAGRTPE